jgi:transcriptional regulator with XRE-family HTH domain
MQVKVLTRAATHSAELVQKLREALNLTQAAFARELSVNTVTVAKWEGANPEPGSESLAYLARYARNHNCGEIADGLAVLYTGQFTQNLSTRLTQLFFEDLPEEDVRPMNVIARFDSRNEHSRQWAVEFLRAVADEIEKFTTKGQTDERV